MIVLGIHTAGPACELALIQGSECLAEQREPMVRGQDARLPHLTQSILETAQITMEQIDRFAVIVGPGSFTGIRVGVAFARGLALATERPCLGITSQEAALPAGQQGSALVAISAQKRPPDITFWTQTFRSGAATDMPEEVRLDALQDRLASHPHMLYGDANALSPHFPNMTAHPATPSALRAAECAALFDPDSHPARPTYARAPDAALPKTQSPA